MSKLRKAISQEHLPLENLITEEYYNKMKEKLSEEEFSKRFTKATSQYDKSGRYHKGRTFFEYYELVSDDDKDPALTEYLLNELLEEQTIATRKLSIISGILIFSLVCSLVSGIIAVIYASKLANLF